MKKCNKLLFLLILSVLILSSCISQTKTVSLNVRVKNPYSAEEWKKMAIGASNAVEGWSKVVVESINDGKSTKTEYTLDMIYREILLEVDTGMKNGDPNFELRVTGYLDDKPRFSGTLKFVYNANISEIVVETKPEKRIFDQSYGEGDYMQITSLLDKNAENNILFLNNLPAVEVFKKETGKSSEEKKPMPIDFIINDDTGFESRGTLESVSYKQGDQRYFYTLNFSNKVYEQKYATLMYSGNKCNVWVIDTNEINLLSAQKIGEEFDNKINPLVTGNFGPASDVDNDGKVSILIYDIKDDFETDGSFVAGYFSTRDLKGVESTPIDLIHIDTYPLMKNIKTEPINIEKGFSTVVHEFQHMVNNNNRAFVKKISPMDTWINEGLSMAAEHMYKNGILEDRISYFNYSPFIKDGYSMLYWDGYSYINSSNNRVDVSDILGNYSLSYLFFQYLRINSGLGNDLFKRLYASDKTGTEAVKEVLSGTPLDMNFQDLLSSFYMAALLKKADGLYGFKNEPGFENLHPNVYSSKNIVLVPGSSIIIKLDKAMPVPQSTDRVKFTKITEK